MPLAAAPLPQCTHTYTPWAEKWEEGIMAESTEHFHLSKAAWFKKHAPPTLHVNEV